MPVSRIISHYCINYWKKQTKIMEINAENSLMEQVY